MPKRTFKFIFYVDVEYFYVYTYNIFGAHSHTLCTFNFQIQFNPSCISYTMNERSTKGCSTLEKVHVSLSSCCFFFPLKLTDVYTDYINGTEKMELWMDDSTRNKTGNREIFLAEANGLIHHVGIQPSRVSCIIHNFILLFAFSINTHTRKIHLHICIILIC